MLSRARRYEQLLELISDADGITRPDSSKDLGAILAIYLLTYFLFSLLDYRTQECEYLTERCYAAVP